MYALSLELTIEQLYPTETSLDVRVAPWRLDLSYPEGNSSSVFTLVVSAFADGRTVRDWEDVKGLDVVVSGNANMTHPPSFAGHMGGSSKPLRDCKSLECPGGLRSQ